MEGEFQDWELLHSSDSDSVDNPRSLDEIEDESGGMIRPDYFSLDGSAMYPGPPPSPPPPPPPPSPPAPAPAPPAPAPPPPARRATPSTPITPAGSIPAPRPGTSGRTRAGSGPTPAATSPTSASSGISIPRANYSSPRRRRSPGIGGKSEELAFGLGEFDLGDLGVKGEYGSSGGAEKQVDVGEIQGLGEDSPKFWSASGGKRLAALKLGEDMSGEEVLGVRNDQAAEAEGGNGAVEDEGLAIKAAKPEGDEDKRTVWWKVPFELLRFCVFRVSPFWSLSVAAAFMGCVILGRRLYKMKQKSRTLQLKITVDDKKVSQFMSRAARLNEAFSVVRRVPVVRPSLPAAGVATWPVMSLR
ncbi:translation initiation factor IF-2 [Eucalyptus grandis]|uniref:translation initiation factor IF-2 n=1 Tax=Eucalyptus grandis TaxID=71139 RepID=UPI00192EB27E|nr:translation initiation factor IF-2 [Eucalyptus grandis]XP_039171333.1 translation initiation factor IF-2 [Eucalyptus grandis]